MDTQNWISLLGMFALIGIAVLVSNNRKKIRWRIVFWGISLQLVFAVLVLKTTIGRQFFSAFNDIITGLLKFTVTGSEFVFGNLAHGYTTVTDVNNAVIGTAGNLGYFAFNVLPTIIFFSSLMSVMYYLGVMQWIVLFFAKIMKYFLGTSGAETLSASANIFVGQTEAPLVVRPYVDKMTTSELMCVMTGGMATVAGGVMAAYVGMLNQYFPDIAGHLLSASILSAPAALVMAKIIVPETGTPETAGGVSLKMEKTDANVIDAAANGAGQGMQLALNVGAMLIAFIALIAMLNFVVEWGTDAVDRIRPGGIDDRIVVSQSVDFIVSGVEPGDLITANGTSMTVSEILDPHTLRVGDKVPASITADFTITNGHGDNHGVGNDLILDQGWEFSFQLLFGYIFWPFAWLMGVPRDDCFNIGILLGEKLVLNEFVAYMHFAENLKQGVPMSPRAVVIATYALCGFSNFSSIAIQIGGIGGIAPRRRKDLAKLGIKSLIAGTLACFMTATVAGLLFNEETSRSILNTNHLTQTAQVETAAANDDMTGEGVIPVATSEENTAEIVVIDKDNLPAASDLPLPPLE